MTSGIAMQGLSAMIVLTAIEKITKMIADAENLIDAKVSPAITQHINAFEDDLGSGNRVLVRSGRLDPTYRITVPRSLDAGQ